MFTGVMNYKRGVLRGMYDINTRMSVLQVKDWLIFDGAGGYIVLVKQGMAFVLLLYYITMFYGLNVGLSVPEMNENLFKK